VVRNEPSSARKLAAATASRLSLKELAVRVEGVHNSHTLLGTPELLDLLSDQVRS